MAITYKNDTHGFCHEIGVIGLTEGETNSFNARGLPAQEFKIGFGSLGNLRKEATEKLKAEYKSLMPTDTLIKQYKFAWYEAVREGERL